MNLKLAVHGITMKYDSFPILNEVEFSIHPGELVGLLGANGAGKSTLLRCISKVLTPTEGTIYLDGHNLQQLTAGEIARTMAVVPQENNTDFDFTVEEIVLMGRFPHLARFQKEKHSDRKIASKAMQTTGISHLSHRIITTLSGGEKQRVMLARALCQEPELLLLDEPTANLDISYQVEIMEMVTQLNKQKNLTVIAAIHDLNMAIQFFDRFILLSEGKVLTIGTAEEVITAEHIQTAYKIPATIYRHPIHGRLQVAVHKKQQQEKKDKLQFHIHVLGGGLESLPVMDALQKKDYSLSVGPVAAQDANYQYASYYGLPVIETPPFSAVSATEDVAHRELLEKANLVIIPPISFGEGNLRNLEIVAQAQKTGLMVLILEEEKIGGRDYTQGQEATTIIKNMVKNGAISVREMEEVFTCLEKFKSTNIKE